MQRGCLKSALAALFPRPFLRFALLVLCRFHALVAAAKRYSREERARQRGPREPDISRYKGERFTAKWIDYSVSRRPGDGRTMLGRSLICASASVKGWKSRYFSHRCFANAPDLVVVVVVVVVMVRVSRYRSATSGFWKFSNRSRLYRASTVVSSRRRKRNGRVAAKIAIAFS